MSIFITTSPPSERGKESSRQTALKKDCEKVQERLPVFIPPMHIIPSTRDKWIISLKYQNKEHFGEEQKPREEIGAKMDRRGRM